jgi:hypothetical protein
MSKLFGMTAAVIAADIAQRSRASAISWPAAGSSAAFS